MYSFNNLLCILCLPTCLSASQEFGHPPTNDRGHGLIPIPDMRPILGKEILPSVTLRTLPAQALFFRVLG